MKDKISKIDWQLIKQKYPNQLTKITKKIQKDYPVQYLIGDVDFYDCYIKVDKRVLIPRFETELFVDKLIQKLKKQNEKLKIIDLGTGSGCIAIAIKKNINSEVTAIDKSKKALTNAYYNAKLNNVKINFFHQKIENVNLTNYDVIISNPPYVAKNEKVDKAIKYEPKKAIFAKNHGLYYYQKIIKKISKLPTKPKLLAFEIGMNQAKDIKKIAKELLKNYNLTVEKDYTNKDRYVFITFKNE